MESKRKEFLTIWTNRWGWVALDGWGETFYKAKTLLDLEITLMFFGFVPFGDTGDVWVKEY